MQKGTSSAVSYIAPSDESYGSTALRSGVYKWSLRSVFCHTRRATQRTIARPIDQLTKTHIYTPHSWFAEFAYYYYYDIIIGLYIYGLGRIWNAQSSAAPESLAGLLFFFLLPSCGWHLSDDANNGLGNLRSTHINGRDVWRFLISNHDENCDGILCWS